MSTEWINGAIEILDGKEGGFYIKVKKDLNLAEGRTIVLTKFEDKLNKLVERGALTQNDVNEKLSKQHFVKYIGDVPPPKPDNSNF